MFLYQRIFIATAALIALYTTATLSAPLYPHDIWSYLFLALSSIFLFVLGIIYNKNKKRVSSLFILATALLPYAFLAEYQYILYKSVELDQEVFKSNLQHAIVVYNMFRFFFLVLCALVLLKELFLAIKNFSRDDK